MEQIKLYGGRLVHGEPRALSAYVPSGMSGATLAKWKETYREKIIEIIKAKFFPAVLPSSPDVGVDNDTDDNTKGYVG